MAEAVFQKLVDEAGLSDMIKVDSAATGSWHIGEKAHSGTRRILNKHGISYNGRARQVKSTDMAAPNSYIITMDESNLSDLKRRFGHHQRMYRLLDFSSQSQIRDVPDPYYTDNFEHIFELITDGSRGLLTKIRENEGI